MESNQDPSTPIAQIRELLRGGSGPNHGPKNDQAQAPQQAPPQYPPQQQQHQQHQAPPPPQQAPSNQAPSPHTPPPPPPPPHSNGNPQQHAPLAPPASQPVQQVPPPPQQQTPVAQQTPPPQSQYTNAGHGWFPPQDNPLDVFGTDSAGSGPKLPSPAQNRECPVPSAKLGLVVAILAFACSFIPVNGFLGKYVPLFTTSIGKDISRAALTGTLASLFAGFLLTK